MSTNVDGVEDATELAGRAVATDPQVGLAAVGALRRLLEQLEALQVDHARAQGWSWAAIACELGVSKQAVHRKHAPRLRLLRR
ncbi:MAG: helix-turn-helix domain-containing protein [Jiangellaceae bacterium]|nr:helix-turn-helix domain-containing protein [Jiangellaceae bacterium]